MGKSANRSLLAALVAVSAATAIRVHAAGFAIDYESARAIGMATAGSAAAQDASTIFYNPAGLAYLPTGNELLLGGQFLALEQRFENHGSTIVGGALPTPGTSGGNAVSPTFVPWGFASYRITPQLTAGVGLFAPFGLATDWGPTFYGRYQNELSSLSTYDLNPTLAYKPLPWLSLAAGLDVQYSRLKLTQAFDLGSACAGAIGLPACATGLGLIPGLSDAQGETRGDGWGFGYTLAAMVQAAPGTRLGLTYRSGVDLHFSDAQQAFVVTPAGRGFLAASGSPLALTGTSANTTISLPGRLTVGLKQSLTKDLDLYLDATMTLWHVFRTLDITAKNPAAGTSASVPQHYRDAARFAAGLEYRFDGPWTVRGGLAYDQTPIPIGFVQAALPDRDRVYASLGASYKPSEKWNVDVGYSHLFATSDAPVNRTGLQADTLKGRFRFSGDVVAVQIRVAY